MSTENTDDDMKKALGEDYERANKLIRIGLPGCMALGMVPGTRPGLIRAADKHHLQLIEELLKRLPDEPAEPTGP